MLRTFRKNFSVGVPFSISRFIYLFVLFLWILGWQNSEVWARGVGMSPANLTSSQPVPSWCLCVCVCVCMCEWGVMGERERVSSVRLVSPGWTIMPLTYMHDVYSWKEERGERYSYLTEGGGKKKETKERERKREREFSFFYIYIFYKENIYLWYIWVFVWTVASYRYIHKIDR